jgi:2-polyprenyl-3-methyl-5-hydroxy-6-metoxy-1,4-benzoquinol methylase
MLLYFLSIFSPYTFQVTIIEIMQTPIMHSKDYDYYQHVRHDVLDMMPPTVKPLLDVGCGEGATALFAKNTRHLDFVAGIEFFPDAAKIAETRLDAVVVGDLDELVHLPFDAGQFDCILCADVLEHTKNPGHILLRLKHHLKPHGVLIASIPNISHIVPLLKIIFDRFEYEESGILDKTHLRFFTLHTIRKMFREAGFTIEEIRMNKSKSLKHTILQICTLGLLERFRTFQYVLRVRPM